MRAAVLLALMASGCAAAVAPPAPAPAAPASPEPVATATPLPSPPPPGAPPAMQWLYGSGEGVAASVQTYRAFADHALAALRRRPAVGVVLANGDLGAPVFAPCGAKPLAVLLDVDETAIQNLGYEFALAARGKSSDGALLDQWQKGARTQVAAMPGAAEALSAVRAAGIAVIFNSNRDKSDSAATAATLANAGLGPAVPGKSLFLRGDADGKGGKDGRRAHVAASHCVVAMAGDQLGDFADGFNDKALGVQQRRALAGAAPFAGLWGRGWFMLSNPVYGPGLRGSIDEVFPPEVRWDGEGTGQ